MIISKIKNSKGYLLIKKPEHPRADVRGYVFEHILVLEKALGRHVLPTEVVHHLNGIKGDNFPGNLMLFKTDRMHLDFHVRLRSLKLSGHWNWRKCEICHQYDDLKNLKSYKKKTGGTRFIHQKCNSEQSLKGYHKKMSRQRSALLESQRP